MTNPYSFEVEQFGISDTSIHLLRNRYNYQTLTADEIESIIIKAGRDLKNWLIVLIFGIGLLCFVLYDILRIFGLFSDSSVHVIYIERILIPLFPLAIGVYSLIVSFRMSRVMIVKTRKKSYYFSLRKLVKEGTIRDFEKFVDEKYKMVLEIR